MGVGSSAFYRGKNTGAPGYFVLGRLGCEEFDCYFHAVRMVV